jgi:hypothetical protein
VGTGTVAAAVLAGAARHSSVSTRAVAVAVLALMVLVGSLVLV